MVGEGRRERKKNKIRRFTVRMRLLSKSLNECYFVISRYVEKHQKEKKVRELNKPKVV